VESLPRRVEAFIAAKGGTNYILMYMYLECNVITVPVGVMVRCLNTFVHIVYFIEGAAKKSFLHGP